MNKNDNSTGRETVFVGTGEFELKGVWANADVEVRDGIVRKIDFTSNAEEDIVQAKKIAEMLLGQPVSRALEVKATEIGSSEESFCGKIEVKVALLEAFHRAVEACFDSE